MSFNFLLPKNACSSIALGTALLATVATGSIPNAEAKPIPVSPSDSSVSSQWANPVVRATDESSDVSLNVDSFPADAVKADEEVRVTLTVKNDSDKKLSDISVRSQRAAAVTDPTAARLAMAAEQGNYEVAAPFDSISGDIEPGQSQQITVKFSGEELGVQESGVYPILFNINGRLGGGEQAYLGSQRSLLKVDKSAPEGGGTPGTPGTPQTPETPKKDIQGMSVLFPITGNVDILPGEVGEAPNTAPLILANDNLAGELGTGGRLRELLTEYKKQTSQSSQLHRSTCLALDPQIVDTVDRMSRGYTISIERPSPVAPRLRLRDSWGTDKKESLGEPGSGQQAATEWISEVKSIAASGSCVVALPWANTDLNSVAATGNQSLIEEALARGSEVITRVVGHAPEPNVVIPSNGYISDQLAAQLPLADTAPGAAPTLEEAWEEKQAARATNPHSQPALNDPTPEATREKNAPPRTPVRVILADNAVPKTGGTDPQRFSAISRGVTAVTYQGSLSAMLASMGDTPLTMGYSNSAVRYDYRMDSTVARRQAAAASIELAATSATEPVLVMPPADLERADGEAILTSVRSLLEKNVATPMTLHDYVAAPAGITDQQGESGPQKFASPYEDPTVHSDTEVLRAAQQANYLDDLTALMANDPAIALRRYYFTNPMRLDILRALTLNDRASLSTHELATSRTDATLNGNRGILQALRSSVSLLPPGNVYTRTSESSPLLIVARNGLPLPVDASIQSLNDKGEQSTASDLLRIPARGSITTQLKVDMPASADRTDFNMWLATPQGAAISDTVKISVQTRTGLVGAGGIAVGLIGLAGLIAFRVTKRRRKLQAAPAVVRRQPPRH